MINKIIKKLESSLSVITHQLLGKGLIPIRDISEKTPTYRLWDLNKEYLYARRQSKEGFRYLVGGILEKVIETADLDELLTFAVEVNAITRNPFEHRVFYADSDYYEGITLNSIKYSRYHRELKSIKGDKDIDLLLKSIRINDEIKINDFSLTEIIIAHQIFYPHKIMATPCLFSEDRGIGKTTLLLSGGYLYDKSEDAFVENVNMGDAEKAKWGDPEIDTRLLVYDDIPNETKVVKALENKIKSSATNAGEQKVNKKGSAQVKTNAYNQAMTTNSLYAIPLDSNGDRRIHPINVHASDYTNEELTRIDMMNIPMSGARDRYYPIMQKILNHLYYVCLKTSDNGLVNKYLNKAVPQTTFKKEVVKRKASKTKRFEIIVKQSTSLSSIITNLSEIYGEEEKNFKFLKDSECVVISNQGATNVCYMYLKSRGLKNIGEIFGSGYTSAKKIALEYFKGKDFKNHTVDKISMKAVRIEMNRDYKESYPIQYEDEYGNIERIENT